MSPAEELADVLRRVIAAIVGPDSAWELGVDVAGVAVAFVIDVQPPGAGRLIGKEGKTISALRRIAQVIGQRNGLTVDLRTKDRAGA